MTAEERAKELVLRARQDHWPLGYSLATTIVAAIRTAEAEAYRRGQEAMRERAAMVARDTEHVVDHPHSYEPYYDTDATLSNAAKAIRALPIEEVAG